MILIYVSFIGIIITSLILWAFAFVGLKHYEYTQQDPSLGYVKKMMHLIIILLLSGATYLFLNCERSHVVPNSAMVEETKK